MVTDLTSTNNKQQLNNLELNVQQNTNWNFSSLKKPAIDFQGYIVDIHYKCLSYQWVTSVWPVHKGIIADAIVSRRTVAIQPT